MPEDQKQIVVGVGGSQIQGQSSLFQQLPKWFRSRSRWQLALVVLAVATLGTFLIILSLAANVSLATSTAANDVVIQYSLPDATSAISATNIDPPATPPFTLYGNGLLVCGHDSATPFSPRPNSGASASAANTSVPTSTVLSQPQIQDLVQKIYNTGFFNLKHEYYKLPIIENQVILRVNTLATDQYVLYYQDVPAPATYTAVITMLSGYCSTTANPYTTSSNTLRILKDPDTSNQTVSNVTSLTGGAQSTLNAALPPAAAIHDNLVAKHAATTSIAATSPYEVDQTIPADQAAALASQFSGKSHKYVSLNGTNYELGLDPQLPKISNQLNINYNKLRAQEKNTSLSSKIKNILSPKTYADATEPVRIVVLVPTDLGGYVNPALTDTSNTLGPAIANWYCGQAGSCYNYSGVSVVQGSLSRAQYMTCPAGYACTTGTGASAQLESIITNVEIHDPSVLTPNVDTLVVPDWATSDLSVTNTCGIGFVGPLSNGGGLAITDLYLPTLATNPALFCQHGHDMAHELGHTFGLNHTGNGTLMDGAPYAGSFCDIADSLEPTCTLDPGQAAALSTDWPFFPTPNNNYGDNVLQVIDQASQPISGVTVNYSGGASTPVCTDGWGSGAVGTSTTNASGQFIVRCLFYGSSGTLQLTSIDTSGYGINPSSAIRLGTPIPVNYDTPAGQPVYYNGASGITVNNYTEGNSVIQVVDASGKPISNASITFSGVSPATNCSGAWNAVWKSGGTGYAYTNSNGQADIYCTLNGAGSGAFQITNVSFPSTYSKYVASPTGSLKIGSNVAITAGATTSYSGAAGGITGVSGDYGDDIIQVTDQAGQPVSGVKVNFTGGNTSTYGCIGGWNGGAGYSTTDNNGEISVRCHYAGTSGNLQITSISTPGYSISASSAIKIGGSVPVPAETTNTYAGTSGISVISQSEGNSVVQVVDASGKPISNASITFSGVSPATNCSGAWNAVWKSGGTGYAYTNSNGQADIYCTLNGAGSGSFQITNVSFPNTAAYSKYVVLPTGNLKIGGNVAITAGTTTSYAGTAKGITGVPGDYGDDIIQVTDQAGQSASGVTVNFTGGTNTYGCQGGWGNGGAGYSKTDNNGQISVRCHYAGSSGTLQITSISTPGYAISSSSAIKVGGSVPVPVETTNHYYGTSGISVINQSEGNSVVQVVDTSGKPINNGYITFNSVAPATNCSGAWNSVWKSGGVGYAYTNSNGQADIFCSLGSSSTGAFQITAINGLPANYIVTPSSSIKVGSLIALSAGTTKNYIGTPQGITVENTVITPTSANVIIQAVDSDGNPASGQHIQYTSNQYNSNGTVQNCHDVWANDPTINGSLVATTNSNGEIDIGCTITTISATFQYNYSPAQYTSQNATATLNAGTTTSYTGTKAIVFYLQPTVTITSPTSEFVSGTVRVSANVSTGGGKPISKVVFTASCGGRHGLIYAIGTVNSPPYTTYWNTSNVNPNDCSIIATAFNTDGLSGTTAWIVFPNCTLVHTASYIILTRSAGGGGSGNYAQCPDGNTYPAKKTIDGKHNQGILAYIKSNSIYSHT